MWVNISYRIFFLTFSNPSFQVPLSLLSFLSGQKFQRAGVRLEHEDLQNIIRFLLLTFRYLSSYLCCSEFGQLKFHNWWVSSLLDQGLHVDIFVQFDVFASFKCHNYLKKHIVVQCCTAKLVSPGQLGRATSLGMTSCPDWKKAATSGPKLPFRRCTSRGVNMVHWFVLSRRSRPCSASARYVQIKYIEEISPIFKYFLMTRTKNCHFALSFKLVDMQWKLGMAVSSDTCRSLNSPYVSLRLKFIEPSGQICQRSFEMTIPQFQVCICSCECSVVGVINYCFDSEFASFFLSLSLCRTFTSSSRRWQLWWRLYDGCVCLNYTPVWKNTFTHFFFCWLSKIWIQMTPELLALHFHFSTNCITS